MKCTMFIQVARYSKHIDIKDSNAELWKAGCSRKKCFAVVSLLNWEDKREAKNVALLL